MNQASNPNMPRSTAEALKQIQKQGLSISVVVTDSRPLPSESPVSKETRVKATMPVEKASKIVARSNAAEKPVLLQSRTTVATPEIRNSGGQLSQSNQVVFQESKVAVSKSSQAMVSTSDSRAFGNQSWSNQPVTLPSESNKPQGISRSSHMISVVPDKPQVSSMTRVSQNSLFTENKLPVSRVVPATHDNKNQVRSVQVSTVPSKAALNRGPNQHAAFEVRPQKSPLGSPPSEIKVFAGNAVVRPPKVYLPVQESKGVSSHNTVTATTTETKSSFASSPKVIGRGIEKSTVGGPRTATVKGILADKNSQAKPDSRSTADQLSGGPSATSDRSANTPFRGASSSMPKKATVEKSSSVKMNRVSQNAEGSMHLQSLKSETVSSGKLASDASQKATTSLVSENSNECSVMPAVFNTARGTAKRPLVAKVVSRPPFPKKKCVKKVPDQIGVPTTEACSISSDESSPEKGKKFLNLKSASDLTITPVRNPFTPSTSGSTKVPDKNSVATARCLSCKLQSSNLTKCDSCNAKIIPEAIQYLTQNAKPGPSYVVTKNITTSIKKEIIYTTTAIPSEYLGENKSYHFKQAIEGQVTIEGNQVVSPRGKGRPRGRRKYAEPECYTLSSDEDDNASMPFNSLLDDSSHHESQMYPGESDGSNLGHSSGSDHHLDENEEEMEDPMFPGVTEISEDQEEMECEGMEEDEEEEEVEYSGEEEGGEDEESPHEDAELEDEATKGQQPTDYPLRCRSIRIGSYKVHPLMNNPYVPVTLAKDCITFQAPVLNQPSRIMSIKLKDHDIRHVMAHFGRCLPIMFIFTTASFAEAVRNALNMTDSDPRYFDPTSKDEKTQKLTFLIDTLTDDQRNFVRSVFPGEKKLKEMDQKTANEILVKSTPHQHTAVKLQSLNPVPTTASLETQHLPPRTDTIPQKVICRTPVVNLFTYPPPPQTGGIAITNEDLACLNEGEFLNDAIIDFYLKYVFYEILTPAQREKTHIFSSYFYPRLTHKPERPRSKDDAGKTMQVRRHDQVKTWTRHVDIFSKDFIIIPVNQNVHWFLAIICYPGRVPEAPEETVQPEPKGSKPADNVSSTVEQEEVQHKVVIKEIIPNGDESDQEDNSNSNSDSSYQVEEPPDSDEPSAESPDSTTHPDGKKRDLPCICIFDSLCGPNRWRIASTLREYLEMEWKRKKGTKKVFDRNTMQGFIMKCPQQTNYSDCGTYVLQYVESFFENPIQCFRAPMPDLTNWFSEAKVSKKRQQLQELILSLQKKLSKTNPSNASIRKPIQSESVPSSPTLQTENR